MLLKLNVILSKTQKWKRACSSALFQSNYVSLCVGLWEKCPGLLSLLLSALIISLLWAAGKTEDCTEVQLNGRIKILKFKMEEYVCADKVTGVTGSHSSPNSVKM